MEIDLLDRALYEGDPQPTYTWLRENEPLYWDATNELWAVSRDADIVAISRDPKRFSSADGSRPNTSGSGSMIDRDDPKHLAFRRVFSKATSPRGAKQFRDRIARVVDDLFEGLAGRREFDLVKELAIPLPVRVIVEALGLDDADWARYAEIAEITMEAGGGPRYQTEEILAKAGVFFAEALGEIEKRQAMPGEDWISMMVARSDAGDAARSAIDIASETLLLLNGGSDTTRHVIAGGTLALIEHPGQFDQLRADPDRLPFAIEEMIRWVSPLLNMSRTATVDVSLHGKTIRAGDQILLMYAAGNRDESAFDHPHDFDSSRYPNPHLAFGIGTHFCMGSNIARLELRLVFESILKKLPGLARAEKGSPKITAPAFSCGLASLPVRVEVGS